MAGGAVWGSLEDHRAVLFWLLFGLVSLTIVFDYIEHTISHWLEHGKEAEQRAAEAKHREGGSDTDKRGAATVAPDSHGHGGSKTVRARSTWEVRYMLWTRFKSEMTVLGFLAFCIWASNQAMLFDTIAWQTNPSLWDDDGSGSGHRRALSEQVAGELGTCAGEFDTFLSARAVQTCAAYTLAPRPSRALADDGDGSSDGEYEFRYTDYYLTDDACPRRTPLDGPTLLHMAEAAHFYIFIAMAAYFGGLGLTLYAHIRRLSQLAAVEANLQSGIAPATAGEKRLERTIHAHRRRLLSCDVLREFAAQKGIDMAALETDPSRINVTQYVAAAGRGNVGDLIAFPLRSWILVWVVLLFFALLLWFGCVNFEPVTWTIDASFYFATLFLTLRVLTFYVPIEFEGTCAARLFEGVGGIFRAYNRCVTGNHCLARRWVGKGYDESIYLTNMQAIMFFQWIFVAWCFADVDSYDVLKYLRRDDETAEVVDFMIERWITECITMVLLVVGWNGLLLPRVLEIFGLPPFMGADDCSDFCRVIALYPHGCPKAAADPRANLFFSTNTV